jgi:hypothetical protein
VIFEDIGRKNFSLPNRDLGQKKVLETLWRKMD